MTRRIQLVGMLCVLLWSVAPCGAREEAGPPLGAAPAFAVAPLATPLVFEPCESCHEIINKYPQMADPYEDHHPIDWAHGNDVMNCDTCHDETEPEYLRTLLDEKVDLARTPETCGACHAGNYRDWQFGAHGKRLDNWQGERVIRTCSHCHDPHAPAIEPRAPMAPPGIRAGLEQPVDHPSGRVKAWERYVPAATAEVRNDDE